MFHSHKPNWDIKTDIKELVFQQTLDSPSQHQNYKNRGKSFPTFLFLSLRKVKSSRPEVFLRTGVLKICSKFTGKHPCRSAISIKLQSDLIETALRHGCSPVNFLQIFRTPFPKNTFGRLLLKGVITHNFLLRFYN